MISLSFGQITLVKTLELRFDFEDEYASLNAIELSSRDRFVLVNTGSKGLNGLHYYKPPKVVVYDNQFNELKSIIIDTTDIASIGEIFVSDKIYNTDDKIELIYSYSKRHDSQSKREKGFIILDEDNNLLHFESDSDSSFSDNNGYYSSKDVNFQAKPIVLGNSVYMVKELVVKGSTIKSNSKTYFYKLGGELPCSYMCNSNSTTNKSADIATLSFNI